LLYYYTVGDAIIYCSKKTIPGWYTHAVCLFYYHLFGSLIADLQVLSVHGVF